MIKTRGSKEVVKRVEKWSRAKSGLGKYVAISHNALALASMPDVDARVQGCARANSIHVHCSYHPRQLLYILAIDWCADGVCAVCR